MSSDVLCRHCPLTYEPHKFVCNCGHHHRDHMFMGGCTIEDCKCDRYSQTQQLLPGSEPKMPIRIAVETIPPEEAENDPDQAWADFEEDV